METLQIFLVFVKVWFERKLIISDQAKQDFTAETEPKPNFGYHSRNTKEFGIYVFVLYENVINKL